jgi:class 3 adenylate cyclase
MAVERHDGLILLADVSGYTTFVGGTELEHGRVWMARLLDLIAQRIADRLSLSAVEGDALLFYRCLEGPDATLVSLLEETYREFRSVAGNIDPCGGCICPACDSGKDLQLKFIAHAGEFVEQQVATRVQLYGHEVNVAHRMLKNHIPAKQYIFVTEAASRYLPLGRDAVPHVEHADVGEVRGTYRLLS